MQNNSKLNTVLLIFLIILALITVWIQWHDRKAEKEKDMTIIPTQSGEVQTLSTILPQYIGAQANWPPVIQNSTVGYSCVVSTPAPGVYGPTIVEKVINEKTYCVSSLFDAGAGQRYGEYVYTTANGDGTKTTSFTLHWPSCTSYGGPDDAVYEQCQMNQDTFFGNLDVLIGSLM